MRADKYFAERFGSRTKAHDALSKGLVFRNGKQLSPDDEVREGDTFLFAENSAFVSRGGDKLERALSVFGADVKGMVFADLGASTGGFTHCLLLRGASLVFAVDVGKSQLDRVLASDPRVRIMDGRNARYLEPADFPVPLDGVTGDLSFISLRLILPAVCRILRANGEAFLLFKPQFECEGKGIGKSGILPKRYHAPLLRQFYAEAAGMGLAPVDAVNAPVCDRKNIEYVVRLRKGGTPLPEDIFVSHAQKFL